MRGAETLLPCVVCIADPDRFCACKFPVRGNLEKPMLKTLFGWRAAALLASAAQAQVPPYPSGFRTRELAVNGTTLHVRVGGKGSAVTLLHGYGETGDMWVPMAADLMKDHTVVVPDLRGMGLSAHPAGGFDKKNQGVNTAQG